MRRILIDGLPRTGTTTLARLFSIHPEACVAIEPFHPKRHQGRHHLVAISATDPSSAFEAAWNQWSVIKHVWESERSWPFVDRPDLQMALWRSAHVVVAVNRRNLLKRYVSAEMSRTLRFWIGTRREFQERLRGVCLLPLDIERAKKSIELDKRALKHREDSLKRGQVYTVDFVFEEFFGAVVDRQLELLNLLYAASGMPALSISYLRQYALKWLESDTYRWSSDRTYRAIPNIDELAEALSLEATDSLFERQ